MDAHSLDYGIGAVNLLRPPPCITVSEIKRIRAKGTVREKAFLGADLASGTVRVHGSKPGMSQALAAVIADSTPLNVCIAVKRWRERDEILAGELPLRPVRFCMSPPWGKEVEEPKVESQVAGIEPEHAGEIGVSPAPAHVQVIDLQEPSDGFLVRLAKAVGATRWLNAGVAADL